MILQMVISFRVSVPVLSEAMTEAEPRVSTECSSLTTALRLAMFWTPMARTTDRMAGSPSGTAATASETPSSRTETSPLSESTPLTMMIVAITTTAMAITVMPSSLLTPAISRCSGVGASSAAASIPAIAPTSVSIAVPVTTARPTPRATAVPL